MTDPFREIDSANGRHNEVTKDEQNSGNADETGHNQAERGVKEKIPPAHAVSLFVRALAIEGNEQEWFAQNEVQKSDRNEKCEAFPNFQRSNEENIPHEHVLNFFVAFGRAAQQQDGGGRRDHVRNSNDRFLRDLAGAFSGDRENRRAHEREAERDGEGRPTFKIEM